jgi:hypothetical protein
MSENTKTINVNGIRELMETVYNETKDGNTVLQYSLSGLSVVRSLLGAKATINGEECIVNGTAGAMMLAVEAAQKGWEMDLSGLDNDLAMANRHFVANPMSYTVELGESVEQDTETKETEESTEATQDVQEEEDTVEPKGFDLAHAETLTKKDLLKYLSEVGVEISGTEKALGKAKLLKLLEERYS